MAIEIKSPNYSFINFNSEKGNCVSANSALPVCEENDLMFQFFITGNSEDIMALPINSFKLILVKNEIDIYNFSDHDLLFTRYLDDENDTVYFFWKNPLYGLKANAQKGCFKLKIQINDGENTISAVSNSFILLDNKCNLKTTVFSYKNDTDYAGFSYCNPGFATNRIRLFVNFSAAKYNEEKAIYRKSNGVIRQLKSVITKEYSAQTEYFNEQTHEKLIAALSHTSVKIKSNIYEGYISKKSEYDIDWTEGELLAQASFKAETSPLLIRNTSCDVCEIRSSDCIVTIAYIVVEPSIEDGIYKYHASWVNVGGVAAPAVSLLISFDGNSWQEPVSGGQTSLNKYNYTLPNALEDLSHWVRITPICDEENSGEPIDFYYNN